MRLKKGDEVTILEGNPAEFIGVNIGTLNPPFQVGGVPLICTPVVYEVIADERISVDNSINAVDSTGVKLPKIGARPRNIVRKR